MTFSFGGYRSRFLGLLSCCTAAVVAVAPFQAVQAQSGSESDIPSSQPFRPGHDAPPPPQSSAAEIAAGIAAQEQKQAPVVNHIVDGGGLRLNAAAYQQVDLHRPISIQLFDDSEETAAIAQALEKTLANAGYRVTSGKAPLEVSFELTGQADGRDPGNQSILQIEGNDRNSIEQQYRAHLNVYSSTQSSLVTGEGQAAQETAGIAGGRPTMRFQLSLTDTTTGKRVWDGWGTGPVGPMGGIETARQMLPVLVTSFGQTIRNQPMPLQPSR